MPHMKTPGLLMSVSTRLLWVLAILTMVYYVTLPRTPDVIRVIIVFGCLAVILAALAHPRPSAGQQGRDD